MKLPGYKRKRLAPGVTEYTRKGHPTNYDTDQPWICWRFLTTDRWWPFWRSNRVLGRVRVEMTCAVCGHSKVASGQIPRFGEVKPPPGGKHPARLRFMLDHLHKDASRHPMAWVQPLLNPAAHKGGIDLDTLAMRLEADLLAASEDQEPPHV